MVADFGFLPLPQRHKPVVGHTLAGADDDHVDDVRVERILKALLAIDGGQYESDESMIDDMIDAVLSDIE